MAFLIAFFDGDGNVYSCAQMLCDFVKCMSTSAFHFYEIVSLKSHSGAKTRTREMDA